MTTNPAGQPPPATGFTTDYLKEEQRQRRAEIERFMGQMDGDQRNALLLSGAIWSWLLTQGTDRFHSAAAYDAALLVAPGAALMFGVRWWALHKAIVQVAEYTRLLEGHAALPVVVEGANQEPEILGWERWLQRRRDQGGQPVDLHGTSFAFWALMLLFNGLLAWFAWRWRMFPR